MAVVAPFCKYKKTNLKIYIGILIIAAVWFAYDGFFNERFKIKHTVGGKADHTLVFHQKSPPYFLAAAALIAVWYWWKIKDKKIVADDEAIIFADGDKIPYNSIESINKTSYELKGFFVIEYKAPDGRKRNRKVSDRGYDNLDAVLELLVSKITN
jgi:hypothetical protein